MLLTWAQTPLYAAVLALFTNGEPGWLFDNSRADTLFSDLAGTTPAVLDGPIGRQTSIAGTAGIYRTTTATANRPTWSGLYNLLKATATLSTQSVTTAAGSYTLYFTGTGSVALSGTATGTKTAGSNVITCTAGTLTLTVTGSVLTADLRPTDQTVTLPTYQWVTTGSGAGTYDVNGFPLYIRPNGSSQFLYIPSLTLGVSTMFLATGVRKSADAAAEVIAELSAVSDSTNGSFGLSVGTSLATFQARGSALGYYQNTIAAAPLTNVYSLQLDVNGAARINQIVPRINGATLQNGGGGAASIGAVNFATNPVYFYARAGTSLFLTGFETCSIGRGSSTLPSAAQIASAEAWTNQRTRAYA